MLRHDLRLAFRSIRRNSFLSALIVAVIAIGIGTSVTAITLYHAKAGNPIWWKNDVLFRVLLDNRPLSHEHDYPAHPDYPPFTLIYRDASALYQSRIPIRSVMMLSAYGLVDSLRPDNRPFGRPARLTTREFFSMFDVPFRYGHEWSQRDDAGQSQVVVISSYLNDRLFGGGNNVGRGLSFDGQRFIVIGIIDRWLPLPRFYDVRSSFSPADDLFLPFRWAESLAGQRFPGYCEQSYSDLSTFKELAASECNVINLWTELRTPAQYQQYRQFLDNYSREQLQAGRFARAPNAWLAKVSTWLEMNEAAGNQSKFQAILALIFLGICVLNALGLLLAKFVSTAPLAGLRRALGATRGDVMRQHLMEVLILGASASAIGIGIAAVGLRLIRTFFFWQSSQAGDNPDFAAVAQSLSHMDGEMILLAVGLSLLAALLAGVYPAWRIGRMVPSTFLKTQ